MFHLRQDKNFFVVPHQVLQGLLTHLAHPAANHGSSVFFGFGDGQSDWRGNCFLPPMCVSSYACSGILFCRSACCDCYLVSADIMPHHRQYILVVRETVTSWTDALFLADK